MELWRNLRVDCAAGMLNSPEKAGESIEQTDKREMFAGAGHSGCFESIAPGMFGEAGEIVVDDVLGYVLPGTCLTKFRPIAGLCAMRKVLGNVLLMSLPPLRYESVQSAFVPKTHADAGLFLLLQAAD